MARDVLLEKLKRELGRNVEDELQVVFVLSRIRKYLEVSGLKKTCASLKFYCDWALHQEIHGTYNVRELLRDFASDKSDDFSFLQFAHLRVCLSEFIEKEEIVSKWVSCKEQWVRLQDVLWDIYSDTPLYVKSVIPGESNKHLLEEIRVKKEGTNLGWSIGAVVIEAPYPWPTP